MRTLLTGEYVYGHRVAMFHCSRPANTDCETIPASRLPVTYQ